ncbi:hypothetical protein Pint_28974 [Pistacia integerrima]|uniref:Uncharacterized protein n=1 Tax=Pistacia integerrima TaxID=434235 RepID=A0ACC0X1H3_9ROSI|nr:hypothetical protein Pint_28974 [Pistacia integerrima]
MNHIVHSYLDRFIVVYLDDIVVYNNTLEEHAEYLQTVFKVLQENKLHVKWDKCSFAKMEVEFLGHKIKDGKLLIDKAKVKAIVEWEAPTKITEMHSCLGVINYYRRFIKDYSTIVASPTDLLKKTIKWEWMVDHQQAFDSLKKVIMEEHVLVLHNHALSFAVHNDAFDFAIGDVLMQDEHP